MEDGADPDTLSIRDSHPRTAPLSLFPAGREAAANKKSPNSRPGSRTCRMDWRSDRSRPAWMSALFRRDRVAAELIVTGRLFLVPGIKEGWKRADGGLRAFRLLMRRRVRRFDNGRPERLGQPARILQAGVPPPAPCRLSSDGRSGSRSARLWLR